MGGAKRKKEVEEKDMKYHTFKWTMVYPTPRVEAKHIGCGSRGPWFPTAIFIVKSHIIGNFHNFLFYWQTKNQLRRDV